VDLHSRLKVTKEAKRIEDKEGSNM